MIMFFKGFVWPKVKHFLIYRCQKLPVLLSTNKRHQTGSYKSNQSSIMNVNSMSHSSFFFLNSPKRQKAFFFLLKVILAGLDHWQLRFDVLVE